MYINFYGNNIENAVIIPTYVYKIYAKVKNRENSNIDILGQTILLLLEEGRELDIDWLVNIIGMPFKYRRLVINEINELLDSRNIEIDSNNIITKINLHENTLDCFYVIYDRVNKVLLDCIIDQNLFEKRYLKNNNFANGENYRIDIKDIFPPNRYTVCSLIKELIDNSNNTICAEENSSDNELEDAIRPFYHISLDTVENVDKPIEANFILKFGIDKEMKIGYESPFSKDNYSIYIEKYIKNKLDNTKLKRLFKNNDFTILEECKKRSKSYIDIYKQFDLDILRVDNIEKIAYFKEVVSEDSDIYKNIGITINNFDKVIKSLLKSITERLGKVLIENKNVKICDFNNLDTINNIEIIKSFVNDNLKNVKIGKKIIYSIGETSIVSYLKSIYLSKYLSLEDYDIKVFDIFSNDIRLNKFLNDVWLYRNCTGHNVEKGKFYNSEYDLDIMGRERLSEVMSELGEELLYFVKVVKHI